MIYLMLQSQSHCEHPGILLECFLGDLFLKSPFAITLVDTWHSAVHSAWSIFSSWDQECTSTQAPRLETMST